MGKLEDYNSKFQATKAVGVAGENLTSGVLKLKKDIDALLIGFTDVSESEVNTTAMIGTIGEDGMLYAQTVAQILGEAKAKIEALG